MIEKCIPFKWPDDVETAITAGKSDLDDIHRNKIVRIVVSKLQESDLKHMDDYKQAADILLTRVPSLKSKVTLGSVSVMIS